MIIKALNVKKPKTKKIKTMTVELTNLTMFPHFSTDLSLRNIYELFPCVPINGIFFRPDKPLPYFGVEGIIISIKSQDYGMRGFRCQTKDGKFPGAMRNCISVDYQYYGKNTNIKIYKNFFQNCCMKSEEEGEDITNSFIEIINKLDETWKPFYELSHEEREEFITDYILPIVCDGNNILPTSSKTLNDNYDEIERTLIENGLDRFIPVVKMFVSFVDFYKTYDEYMEKLNKVIFLETNEDSVFTIKGPLEFIGYMGNRGIYDGDLHEKDIILGFVSSKLLSLGLECSFSNEKGKTMEIISSTGLEDGKMTPNSLIHQISINDTGTLKILSPGKISVVIEEAMRIIEIIKSVINSDDYPGKRRESVGKRIISNIMKKRQNSMYMLSPTTSADDFSEDTDELM